MLRSRAARTKLRWTWRRGTGMNGLPEYFGATLKRDENGDRNSHTGIEIDIPCTNGCKSIVRKGVNYELCIIPSCVLFSNPLRYAKNIFLCTTPTYFPPSTIQRYRNPNFENNSNTNSIGAFRLNAIGPYSQKSPPERRYLIDIWTQICLRTRLTRLVNGTFASITLM